MVVQNLCHAHHLLGLIILTYVYGYLIHIEVMLKQRLGRVFLLPNVDRQTFGTNFD